ncbi:MAG: MmgE/PrpD family protein [Thermoleophilia bacterium]|nr:MmgE/PrpD family protein [Thermoleophilia bacterium]
MTTAAETIAGWATTVTLDDVPADVLEHAKLHALDVLGCGLAADAEGVAQEGRATMAELGGEPQATVIGSGGRLPAANAAFANAMLCHGLDFDDTHSDSVSHVSAVVTPAALAAGEAVGATGRDVLAAIVVGNEVTCRVGMAAPGAFHKRGFHPTAICGIFGGVAAVSRLFGADAGATTRALGIAGSFAGGLFAYLEDGTPTKPMHPAWAAHGATIASRLAAHGAIGPRSVLEGKFGLYHAFLDAGEGEVDIAGQVADLGRRWETPRIAYKPYPVCHFMHGSLGAAAEALAGRTLAPGEIAEVVVRVPAAGVSLVLEPAPQKVAPRSEYEGKFSLQYSVASMLVRGHVAVSDFTDEAIADPAVLEVAAKVRYETREYPTYPQAFPGATTVRLVDGTLLEADFPHQAGAPENPLSADEVRAKFRENASLALDEPELVALEEAILSLERNDDLTAALAPLVAREGIAV